MSRAIALCSENTYAGCKLNDRTSLSFEEVQSAARDFDSAVDEWNAAVKRIEDLVGEHGESWGIFWDYEIRFQSAKQFADEGVERSPSGLNFKRNATEVFPVRIWTDKAAKIRRRAAKLHKLIDAALASTDRRWVSAVDDWRGQLDKAA